MQLAATALFYNAYLTYKSRTNFEPRLELVEDVMINAFCDRRFIGLTSMADEIGPQTTGSELLPCDNPNQLPRPDACRFIYIILKNIYIS